MAYGTLALLQDALHDYSQYISTAEITTAQFTRYLEKASRYIDAKLATIPSIVLPLVSPPEILDDIAVSLAVCYTLRFLSVEKDPDATEYMKLYCEEPITMLDDLISKNPALFVSETASAVSLMLSNMAGKKRTFTVPIDDDDSDETEGTMTDW